MHLHGDHCYGLFGLLHLIRKDDDNEPFTLNIYGPKGIRKMIETTLALSGGLHHYTLNIRELELTPDSEHETTAPSGSPDDTVCATKFGADSTLFLFRSLSL